MRRKEIYMVLPKTLKLVNHEAWIGYGDDRAYLKWGHFPETDGKLDPNSIKRAFTIDPGGNEKAIVFGSDKVSSKGALFLEPKEKGLIAIEYDRGIYSVTKDNKWVFGEKKYVSSLGYSVKESMWMYGFAKAYNIDEVCEKVPMAGFELEIVPEVIRKFKAGDKLGIQLLFRDNPVEGEIGIRDSSGKRVVKTDEKGFTEIKLEKGVNVISGKYIDEMAKIPGVYDKKYMVTTLTITAE